MDRISELEDRIGEIEASRMSRVTHVDNAATTKVNFDSSSYYVDVDIDIMCAECPRVTVTFNGVVHEYSSSYISDRYKTNATNTMTVSVEARGLLSKRIKIEGIGVRLSTI